MTALPDAVTKVFLDQGTDSAASARSELADHVDKFNVMRSYLTGLLGTDGVPATALAALGAGSAAAEDIGTSGANVPLMSTANLWTLAQTLANNVAWGGRTTGGTTRSLIYMSNSNIVQLGHASHSLNINGNALSNTELTAGQVDTAADFLPIFDAGAGSFKKVKPDNLGVGGFDQAGGSGALSGTTDDITGLPAGMNIIIAALHDVSFNAGDNVLLQLGDAGGIETTGYVSTGGTGGLGGGNWTTGFGLRNNSAASVISGVYTFTRKPGTNLWVGGGAFTSGNDWIIAGGDKTLSGEADRMRLTTEAGTASFDGGTWEVFSQ